MELNRSTSYNCNMASKSRIIHADSYFEPLWTEMADIGMPHSE